MKTNAVRTQQTYANIEEYEKECYLFSPSISKRRNVGGKTYFVRRYFKGGKDFENTMKTLAVQETIQNAR